MSQSLTLQPEAGDDRNPEVEIQRLNEMYYGPAYYPEARDVGAGGIKMHQVGPHMGHMILRRSHIHLDTQE